MCMVHKKQCPLFILFFYATSVRPKPGFGIRNRNQGPDSVSVLETRLFSIFFIKQNFNFFPTYLWDIFFCFEKLKIEHRFTKIISKSLIFGRKSGLETLISQIIPCLVALELWLPVPVQFCCIFAATKDKFGSFLQKLFHSSTSHTYHHNSSWTIRQARNYLCLANIPQLVEIGGSPSNLA